MASNDQLKKFKRTLARNGLYISSWIINNLPFTAVRFISGAFIAVGFCLTVKQRQIASESLNIAFKKEKTSQEIEGIIKSCFENLGKGMIELIYFMEHSILIGQTVTFEGREHLDRAFAQGKGVIAVSAHFGNFPLMLLRLAQVGYKTNAIIRPARDQEIEKYFLMQRTRLGLNTIYSLPRKECVESSLRVLRGNELLFIPLDQNFGSGGGVFVDFFGQKAATATGPVVFALRTRAPILPMFIVRQPDNTHKIIIEPPLILEEKGDDQEKITVNIAKITKLIEQYVRRYPQEWGWMHRRWKSRPAGEGASIKSSDEEMIS